MFQNFELSVDKLATPERVAALREALTEGKAGHGEVRVTLHIDDDTRPQVLLGRDFALGSDLLGALESIPGIVNVQLAPIRGVGHLRLVA